MRWTYLVIGSLVALTAGCKRDTGIEDMPVDKARLEIPTMLHAGLLVGGNWNTDRTGNTLYIESNKELWSCDVRLRGISAGIDVGANVLPGGTTYIGIDTSQAVDGLVVENLFERYTGAVLGLTVIPGVQAHLLSNKSGVSLAVVGLTLGLNLSLGWDSIDLKRRGKDACVFEQEITDDGLGFDDVIDAL